MNAAANASKKILIADDDSSIRLVLSQAFAWPPAPGELRGLGQGMVLHIVEHQNATGIGFGTGQGAHRHPDLVPGPPGAGLARRGGALVPGQAPGWEPAGELAGPPPGPQRPARCGGLDTLADHRRQCVESVEQKVRVDLRLQELYLRLGQQPLLLVVLAGQRLAAWLGTPLCAVAIGAGRRIGAVLARRFAKAGWHVVIHYRSSATAAGQCTRPPQKCRGHHQKGHREKRP